MGVSLSLDIIRLPIVWMRRQQINFPCLNSNYENTDSPDHNLCVDHVASGADAVERSGLAAGT